MKFFDSHIDKSITLNKVNTKLPVEISTSSRLIISKEILSKNINIEVIAKKQSGDSFLNISFFKEKELLKSFKETIDNNIFIVKKINCNLTQFPDEIIIEKNKGSIGKIIINRIVISSEQKEIIEIGSRLGFIVPYTLYGGAEVYLENLIKESPNNMPIDIIINQDNKIKNANFPSNVKIKYFSNNIYSFLKLNEYEQVIFYNSKKIYNDLLLYKKENSAIKYYEIYHSDFLWPDAIASDGKREGVSAVFKTSLLVGTDINVDEQIICPPPLDFEKFNFSRKKEKIKTLGFIGRLSREKDPLFAVNLANKLGLNLLIAGDGPLRNDVLMSIKNNYNIKYLGWQNSVEFYKKIDCLILTSEMEGTPNVILESIASGLPVISSNVGGISDILEDTVSFLFDKNNFEFNTLINFVKNNYNYNYENILKAKKYNKDIICKNFFSRIIKDYKKPIEVNISNNYSIIDGILL